MRIGRLEFGITYWVAPVSTWRRFTQLGSTEGGCGCRIFDVGPFYFTWIGKNCKCVDCGKYKCECQE